MARIFISHATKDEALVEDFVELLQLGIGVHPDDVFCSSLPGMGIPAGQDFVAYIKSKIENPEAVLIIVSQEFLKSPFCHNEVGASWALSLPIHPILVPPVDYNNLPGVLKGKQAMKINDKEKLNDLHDDLTLRLGLKPIGTSHWERKRDRFLSKLSNFLTPNLSAIGPPATASTVPTHATAIASSGSWIKLDSHFFEATKVQRPGKERVLVEIVTHSAEEDAALERLRLDRPGRGRLVGYAYQNDGGLVQINSLTSTSQGGTNIWSIELIPTESAGRSVMSEMSYNDYSADEIAEMRVGRLLINDPPPHRQKRRGSGDNFLDSFISRSDDAHVKFDECVIRKVVTQYREDVDRAIRFARLEAVFLLKAGGVIDAILELALGPLEGKKLHVRFRGVRPRAYQNVEPPTITVEGDCVLG